MESVSFFSNFLVLLVAATIVALFFERLRLPSILGFLIAGVLVGPSGLGLIADTHATHMMAEVGVALLMLSIGLELSLDRLKGMRQMAMIGGSLQICLSLVVAIFFARLSGWSLFQGFFLGSVIALSSTAIVLKNLVDRGELDTHYGRIAVSILIFQDLAVVPMMILTTSFGDTQGGEILTSLLQVGGKMTGFLALVFISAKYLIPPFLRYVAMRKNREVFFLTCIVICLGISWLSSYLGFSFAIGAFFAGVLFANTDYGDQLSGEITSFRHIFVSVFFVSIGMIFNLQFAIEHIGWILLVVGLVLVINFVVMSLIIMGFKYPPRIAFASGLILSQMGEFSFLLLEAGKNAGAVEPFFYNILLSTAFITMMLTPFLFMLIKPLVKVSEGLSFMGAPPKGKHGGLDIKTYDKHVILCGYGVTGHALGNMLQEENIPFVLIEMNPKHIQEARKNKINVIYGDAANREIMLRAGVMRASAVVVSFGDSLGLSQIIKLVEKLNPDVTLAVRTRYARDAVKFYELGCDVVVMEEWEASEELNRLILERFEVPKERIEHHIAIIRQKKELVIEEALMRRNR